MGTTDEFLVRYYRWALLDCEREVDADFPLLGAIMGSAAMRAVGFLRSMTPADRRRAATALVKQAHRRAVELTGDIWGAAEEALVESYRMVGRVPRPEEEPYRRALAENPRALDLDEHKLLTAVRKALAPGLGTGEAFAIADQWQYATPIGGWVLTTLIDVGGAAHQLSYRQAIGSPAGRPLKADISILSWLGLGGGHTPWNRLTDAGIDAAAAAAAAACTRFVSAATELLKNLSPDA